MPLQAGDLPRDVDQLTAFVRELQAENAQLRSLLKGVVRQAFGTSAERGNVVLGERNRRNLVGRATALRTVFMRTDDGEVLIDDYSDGFYFGMRLNIDDWKPFIPDREIGMATIVILGHCTTMIGEDEGVAVMNP